MLTAGDQRIAGNGVTLAGTGSLISPAGSISVDAGSGALALAGPVQAAQAVTLAGQSITGAGSITGATLTVTSSGPASFSGPVSTQGRQSFATQGLTTRGSLASQSDGIALDAGGGALAIGAPVSAAGLIDLRGGSIAVAGPVLTPGAVTLNASGGPVSMTSAVSAGSVTVQGGAVTLAPSSSTSADSAIQVTGTAVTLAGQESAPRLLVTASSITLQGGQITVGGVVQVARSAIGLPLAADGGPGAYFETASAFSQTGTTRVLAIGSQATVRVDLTSGGGTVVFSDLNAPTSNLAIGSGAGSATGQLVVNQLSLLFSGTSGSARLAGIVHQQSGNGAAAASAIFPRPDRQFQVNGCAVSSINCIVLNPQLVPVFNPLKELSLSFFREQEDDPELLVPNVTEQGL